MSARVYFTTSGPGSTDAVPQYAMRQDGETVIEAVSRSIGRALGRHVGAFRLDSQCGDRQTYQTNVGFPAVDGGYVVSDMWVHV